MKSLVTGAAGFIGFHTSLQLLELGHEVIGLDNINDYYDVNLKNNRLKILQQYDNFTFQKQNLEDKEQIDDAIDTILNEKTESIEKERVHHFVQSIKSGQTNLLNKIMDKNNPVQSAIIFKEIFDKPRSLRKKIR